MSWLLAIGLKNAIFALPLAALALAVSRWSRRPALAHLLWVIVLIKLLTPPLIDVPVGWKLDVERWLNYPATVASPASGALANSNRAGSNAVAGYRDAPRESSRITSGKVSQRAKLRQQRAQAAAPAPSRWKAATMWLASAASWPLLVGLLWFSGSVVAFSIFAWRARRFRRYLRWATGRDEYLGPRVAELAHSVGLTIPPKTIVVDGIVSPMLFGLGQRACLIFPARLAKRLSPQKLDSLLLHELAHYSRGDHWIRALELVAVVVYWWNPIVWLARRQIEAAEEECCDAWVVEHLRGTRYSYAEALLTTIDFLCDRPPILPPVACGLGEVQLLRLRLTQIMRGQVTTGLSRSLHVAVIVAGLVICPLEPALWATSAPDVARPPRTARSASSLPTRVAQASASVAASSRVTRVGPSAASSTSISTSLAPGRPLPPPARPAVSLWATAVAPNGKLRLEARSGRQITLISQQFRLDMSAHQIRCVSFAPDSRIFATGHPDALVRIWDGETGGLESSLKGSQAEITSVHISPDGSRLAAGARDGSVVVWELASGEITAQLPSQSAPVSCVRWSASGDRLAIAVGDFLDRESSQLLIWSPDQGTIETEQPLEEPAGAIAWFADDEALLIAAWSGQASVWNVVAAEPGDSWQVDKDLVSASAWSADCPLVPQLLAEQYSTASSEP
ncbi:MAG TPA: M56 family metallopeptidase [Pirellulaceae bacterium]|nr:M56 family metallopeptidase [Pirellulaceae bacterium]